MKPSTGAIVGLSVLLVASNLFWVYTVLDGGVSFTYLQSSYDNARGTALQAIAVSAEVARSTATRQSVIDAAAQIQPGVDPFEKEGFVWVGDIGLRFDDTGKFVEAKPAVEPF
jgi:hypothetical protein